MICEIAAQTDFTDGNRVLFNLWDDLYYYDFDGYSDFIKDFIKNGEYVKDLRLSALESYYERLNHFSVDNQTAIYHRLQKDICLAQEKLKLEKDGLNVFEKAEIMLMRCNPNSRINSPSFLISATLGTIIIGGLNDGLTKGGKL